jgi:hypothetical protein
MKFNDTAHDIDNISVEALHSVAIAAYDEIGELYSWRNGEYVYVSKYEAQEFQTAIDQLYNLAIEAEYHAWLTLTNVHASNDEIMRVAESCVAL